VNIEEGDKPRDIPKKHRPEERDTSLRGDNQELLRLWLAGLTAKEIGRRTGKTEKTILNRLTVLRRAYGEERIPRRK
jgi:DNA-binding CsgD family transcriptional regulator